MKRVGPLVVGLLCLLALRARAQDSIPVCMVLKENAIPKGLAKRGPVDSATLAKFAAKVERHRFRGHGPLTPRLGPIRCGMVRADDFDHLREDPAVDSLDIDRPDHPTGEFLISDNVPPPAEQIPWNVAWLWNGIPANDRGEGVLAGPMDSGTDTAHVDNKPFTYLTDATGGGNVTDNIPSCNGHGTHVTGTIGARVNGIGVVGVAPGVRLVFAKVFIDFSGGCSAFESTQIQALNWAVQNHVRVMSASLGSSTACSAGMATAIQNASAQGTDFLAATGNSGNKDFIDKPASCPGAYAIGSHNSAGQESGFSQWGSQGCVEVGGEGITSTMPGGGWGDKSGTSMATPGAAGALAILIAAAPSSTPAQRRSAFCQGRVPLNLALALGRLVDPLNLSSHTADLSDGPVTIQVDAVVPWCAASERKVTRITQLPTAITLDTLPGFLAAGGDHVTVKAGAC